MANLAAEAPPVDPPPVVDSTAIVLSVPPGVYGAAAASVLMSKRDEVVRKRQREYQAAHLKRKKDEAEATARELALLRNEHMLVAQSLMSALPATDRPSISAENFDLLKLAQVVAGRLLLFSGGAGPSITGACAPTMPVPGPAPAPFAMPAQGPAPAPAPPPANGPVLGNWPMIVRMDQCTLTTLLQTIKDKLPLDHLLQQAHDHRTIKLNKDNKADIDITSETPNEAVVQEIADELKRLLGITTDDSRRCEMAARVLKLNTQAAIGAYLHSCFHKAHGHYMGVLNILIGGTKRWRFWRPGPRPGQDRKEDECIDQQRGELLWLPPGWWHEVLTTGISYVVNSPFRDVNLQGGVAHSITCWHVPPELRAQTVAAFALGMSIESQYPLPTAVTADMKQRLYDIFVDSPVKA